MSDDKDTRQEYYDTVRSLASAALLDAEPADAVHELVDGNYWVIYTHAALKTIQHSDNWLEIDDIEPSWPAGGFSALVSQAAYYAMCQDVFEAMADLADNDEEDS